MTKLKTRFCPSPTGFLHLGNVRTALFSALFAAHAQGDFLLRIEDTDKTRSEAQFSDAIMQDLQWLNLQWQDGPYYQSARQAIYDQYYDQLIAKKVAYPCFCTEAQLSLQRTLQQKMGKPPRYSGTCFGLSQNDIQEKINSGLKPTLRFHIPDGETISFHDLVRGEQKFNTSDLGDFIIRRTDGTSPFMYCNAIDDALMGVTHVLRGEDHLTNTPRQIAILRALQLPIPTYAHIALITGPDNTPLSKRHGSRSLHVLRDEGFLPMAIVNYLARLGHYYGHDRYLTLPELAADFKTDALSKSPAKYNEQQLLFWQAQAIQKLTDAEFFAWAKDAQQCIPTEKQTDFIKLIKANVQFPADVKKWAQALFVELLDAPVIENLHPDYFKESLIAFEQYGANAEKIITHIKEKCGLKGKSLFMPLRMILTGHEHGPDLSSVMQLMDARMIKKRLELISKPL